MPIAFYEKNIVDFLHLDAAADQTENDFPAVTLTDAFHDAVHSLIKLFLSKWFDDVMRSMDTESFDSKFITCRKEYDFGLTFLASHCRRHICSQHTGHADV